MIVYTKKYKQIIVYSFINLSKNQKFLDIAQNFSFVKG
jgi:hypothetical protein